MMDDDRRIKPLLLMILMLPFTGALTTQLDLYLTVRDGDDVTLLRKNVVDEQRNCDKTTWIFVNSRSRTSVELVNLGQIRSKPDRLRLTSDCSLVMKKVSAEDAGRYICRHFDKSGREQGPDALVVLSVVTMTEHDDTDQVNLTCSVGTFGPCRHSVRWLHTDKGVDKDNKELITSQSSCSASVRFLTTHFSYTSRYELFKCQVITDTKEVKLFTFGPPGENLKATSESQGPAENNRRTDVTTTSQYWLWCIFVAVGLAFLSTAVVAVNIWTRTKGKTTETDGNAVGLRS